MDSISRMERSVGEASVISASFTPTHKTHRFLVTAHFARPAPAMTYALSHTVNPGCWRLPHPPAVSIPLVYPDCFLYKSAAQDTFIFNVATVAISLIAASAVFGAAFYREPEEPLRMQLCIERNGLKTPALARAQSALSVQYLQQPVRHQLKEPTYAGARPDFTGIQLIALSARKFEQIVGTAAATSWEFIEKTIRPEKNNYIAPMMLGPFIENAFNTAATAWKRVFGGTAHFGQKFRGLENGNPHSIPKNIRFVAGFPQASACRIHSSGSNILYPANSTASIHTSISRIYVNLSANP
ncbi:hypothetical protein FQR65_LT20188 [Abscondita terminalis]|nr:hypothetical protein FQR65_LT20188 [Abscondita terminalis]